MMKFWIIEFLKIRRKIFVVCEKPVRKNSFISVCSILSKNVSQNSILAGTLIERFRSVNKRPK